MSDLPPASDYDYETRCVVVWQDREHPQDQGAELCTLSMIRDGDYCENSMVSAVWRSIMDAPPMIAAANDKAEGAT